MATTDPTTLVPDMFVRSGTSSFGYVIYTSGDTDMWDFEHNRPYVSSIPGDSYFNRYTPQRICDAFNQPYIPRHLRVSEGL